MKAARPRRLALVAAAAVAAAVLVGFLALRGGDGDNGSPGGSQVRFGSVTFSIDSGARQGSARCALLAENEPQRSRGLMARTDLGPYAGMIFRFPRDTTAAFYMRNTPMPLSIAWFDVGGLFVSAEDMAPCPDREGCPLYGAAGPYRYALEVPQGRLPNLGIGPGSRLRIGDNCQT